MRLALGATGFRDRGDEPLPTTDVVSFRRSCYEAARDVRASVVQLAFSEAASFDAVTIGGCGWTRAVLCHVNLPFVAVTNTSPVPGRPVSGFVDPPGWAGIFERIGLRALHAQELSVPMAKVNVSDLSRAELSQIRYWRPAVLSDVLFNWWD